MKTKIKVRMQLKNKVIEQQGEYNQRNLLHLQTQLNNPSKTFTPKKGKGSYKRNKKVNQED